MPHPETEYAAPKTEERSGSEADVQAMPQNIFLRGLRLLRSRVSGSQLKRNMRAGSAMAVVGMSLSILSYPIYLHYLGYHRYGLWLVLSVVVSVAQLGNLGVPWALMKLVAEEHGSENWEGVRAFINIGCGIILAIGIIFLCAVTLLRPYIVGWFKLTGADSATVYSMLPYVALLSALVLLFSTFNSALGGLGRMDLTSYNETLAQMLVIPVSGSLLYLGFDVRGMVFGALFSYCMVQAISFVQVQRILPIPLLARTHISRHRVRQLFGTGGWILAGGVCISVFMPFTRLILSRYAGMEAVTVNDMCMAGSARVRNIFDFAFRPMMPEASNLLVRQDGDIRNRIKSIDRNAFVVIFAVASPVFVTLLLVMNPLLHLWLHRSFNALLPGTFRITLVGVFASLLGSSALYMLIGLGRARDMAYASAIQLAVNVVVLSAIAAFSKHLTVTEAAMTFGVAAACSTLYLRLRLYIFTRHNGEKLHSLRPAGGGTAG